MTFFDRHVRHNICQKPGRHDNIAHFLCLSSKKRENLVKVKADADTLIFSAIFYLQCPENGRILQLSEADCFR